MVNIIDYLKLSNECQRPIEQISTAEYLKENYFKIDNVERVSLINFLIISNFCYAFKTKPIVYEQITQYISDKFKINKNNIVLIGSAKTGFAIDPINYGRRFTETSDLDFAIINEKSFEECIIDFKLWKKPILKGESTKKLKKTNIGMITKQI